MPRTQTEEAAKIAVSNEPPEPYAAQREQPARPEDPEHDPEIALLLAFDAADPLLVAELAAIPSFLRYLVDLPLTWSDLALFRREVPAVTAVHRISYESPLLLVAQVTGPVAVALSVFLARYGPGIVREWLTLRSSVEAQRATNRESAARAQLGEIANLATAFLMADDSMRLLRQSLPHRLDEELLKARLFSQFTTEEPTPLEAMPPLLAIELGALDEIVRRYEEVRARMREGRSITDT